MAENSKIIMFGANWCHDCVRTTKQLNELGVPFEYINIEEVEGAADEAKAISGRINIPVMVYPDGTHQVEPSNKEVEAKLTELSII